MKKIVSLMVLGMCLVNATVVAYEEDDLRKAKAYSFERCSHSLQELNSIEISLKNLSLRCANLSDLFFYGADLSWTELQYVDFSYARLKGTNFEGVIYCRWEVRGPTVDIIEVENPAGRYKNR